MKTLKYVAFVAVLHATAALNLGVCQDRSAASLPSGVKAVWDLGQAYHESTTTRDRVCINGLWRWQPAQAKSEQPPAANWGYFKVPGPWPAGDRSEDQTLYPHPAWKDAKLGEVTAAWYQREIDVPKAWAGRRIAVTAEYVNSYAAVYVDGKKAGEVRFPGGEVDITSLCSAGGKHMLSLQVVALPLHDVMLTFSDTAQARTGRGNVARRGLCGDVYLLSTPKGPRIADVKIDTSVRKGEITVNAALPDVAESGQYTLRAAITDKGKKVAEFTSKPFAGSDLKESRIAFTEKWMPERLWDIHTPQNMYDVAVSLVESGKLLDTTVPMRFGFREFWIDGRDFYLNGTRIFLSCVVLSNGQNGAALATYEAAKESMQRLQSFGINYVYTGNYGCEPGSHLGFAEILRAADDTGMLIAFSQPHFGHYDWKAADAEKTNGFARHAEFYVRAAQNHPAVVFYAMSHNATGYDEDMNPDQLDGKHNAEGKIGPRTDAGALRALKVQAIVEHFDPTRIVYHHSSGTLGNTHTNNFYTNFAPSRSFATGSSTGVRKASSRSSPSNTTLRALGTGPCIAAGTRGPGTTAAPGAVGVLSGRVECPVPRRQGLSDQRTREKRPPLRGQELPARRTVGTLPVSLPLGLSLGRTLSRVRHVLQRRLAGIAHLGHVGQQPHAGARALLEAPPRRRQGAENAQGRLGPPAAARLQPDCIADPREQIDLGFERTDWIPTLAAKAVYRNNLPLLAYIGGKSAAFTSKDHNFLPGETVDKQLIIINNCRETVACQCQWSLGPAEGRQRNGHGERHHRPAETHSASLRAARRFGAGQIRVEGHRQVPQHEVRHRRNSGRHVCPQRHAATCGAPGGRQDRPVRSEG